MSIPAGNGAPSASGTGFALGYTLILFWFNILFMLISENNMNTSTYFVHTLSLIYVMKFLVIFEIKIYRKLTRYLTRAPPCSLALGMPTASFPLWQLASDDVLLRAPSAALAVARKQRPPPGLFVRILKACA